MTFSLLNLALFVSLASAAAIPNAAADANLDKRVLGGVHFPFHSPSFPWLTLSKVRICDGANFTGTCANVVFSLNVCQNLSSTWDNRISSFDPDAGTTCFLYL
ncbi:hypothetical protein K440DRAFT_642078 [Wilcoxina mikolae CBS 423.85]|nr:hypothetical protein K440DRAFT_642078 [Wilcoxina mikolae CBS 423.85]